MRNSINRLWGILCYPFGGMEYYNEDYFGKLCAAYRKEGEEWETTSRQARENAEKKLFNNLYEQMFGYYRIGTYDEIKLLFKRYYYSRMDKYFGMRSYGEVFVYDIYLEILGMIAAAFISTRDDMIVYKYWKSERDEELMHGFDVTDKILLYHALIRRIPIDIVVAAYLAVERKGRNDNYVMIQRQYGAYCEQVNLADLQLDKILSEGVAENHVHLTSAANFQIEWQMMMNYMRLPMKAQDWLKKRKWKPKTKIVMERYKAIQTAVLIRIILSRFLGIHECEDSKEKSEFGEVLGKDSDIVNKLFDSNTTENELESILQSQLNLHMSGTDIVDMTDIIAKYLRVSFKNAELYFLYLALRYIYNNGKRESIVMQLFFKYLRIKHEIYRELVQNDDIRGLDYFHTYFESNNSLLVGMSVSRFKIVPNIMTVQFANKHLKKIEFRVGIMKSAGKLRENFILFLRAYHKVILDNYCDEESKVVREFPKVAIVYHLNRRDDNTSGRRCWRDYVQDKQMNVAVINFLKLQNEYLNQVSLLKELRNSDYRIANYIVGLDAASMENVTPVWVFAPIFERARDGRDDTLYESSKYPVRSLRFTFHAGEDFRHILSGIRRIDEVIRFCKFHAGDRIGHGVALGIDPEEWAAEYSMITIPRIEMLENLLWAWMVLSEEPQEMDGIKFYLEENIYHHAKEIYGNMQGVTVNALLESYKLLFSRPIMDWNYEKYEKCCDGEICFMQPEVIDNSNECFVWQASTSQRNVVIWDSERLVLSRHCACYAHKMEEPLYYKVTKQEIQLAVVLQRILKRKVGNLGIVIEVCPSSNTVISYTNTLFKNQAFLLNGFINDTENVMLCINSDNPSCAATNISNELAYVYYGLLAHGMDKEHALQWINRVRKNGMDMSFVTDDRTKDEIWGELVEMIKDLE